jgi:hypothetical protein
MESTVSQNGGKKFSIDCSSIKIKVKKRRRKLSKKNMAVEDKHIYRIYLVAFAIFW